MIETIGIVLVALLVLLGPLVVVMFYLYGWSWIDERYCPDCHVKMRETGYIAHGFKRAYTCPLCNWTNYIADPMLKAAKIREGA